MTLVLAILALAFATICAIVAANRLRRVDFDDIEIRPSDQPLAHAGPDLCILTWNIGYGALGKGADVYVDGGTSLRALSKEQIVTATNDIAQRLSQTPADLVCIQEIAQPGFLTRNVDVLSAIDSALPSQVRYFWGDLKTVMLPQVLRASNGMTTYSSKFSKQCRVVELPNATTHMLGFIKKPYVGLVNKLPILGTDKAWVIINIHLPFFKTTQTERLAQLDCLFDVAKEEYENGNYVVIAGDWNMRLCQTSFEHRTDLKFLKSFKDFPKENLPAGWQIKTDPGTPTVRALNAAFNMGQTYTTIFDGFVVSPNVCVSNVETLDLHFAQSDHQPVRATFEVDR